MPTYFERYQQGEHRQVWAELIALGEQVRREPLYSDAGAVAQETMRRVRTNVETLVARLHRIEYRFGLLSPAHSLSSRAGRPQPHPEFTAPHIPPAPDVGEQLRRAEETFGPLPLSLRAWYEIVGSADFRGHHPVWVELIDSTDPFVIEPLEPLLQDQGFPSLGDPPRYTAWLSLFPDFCCKEYYAGVGPIYALLPWPEADTPLWFEGQEISPVSWPGAGRPFQLVEYLRFCLLQWGGFPGFDPDWSGDSGLMSIEQLRQETERGPGPGEDAERYATLRRLREHLDYLREGLLPF
jgi:hypothetical protein